MEQASCFKVREYYTIVRLAQLRQKYPNDVTHRGSRNCEPFYCEEFARIYSSLVCKITKSSTKCSLDFYVHLSFFIIYYTT